MKLLYICHESLPSRHTNTEQLVHTVSELTKIGYQVDLIIPKNMKSRRSVSDRQGELASYYGIDPSVFKEGLNLIERPLPKFWGSRISWPIHDMRAARFGRCHGYDLVYTRDPFALLGSLAFGARAVFETYRSDINVLSRYRPWRSYCFSRSRLLGIITHSQLSRQSFLQAGMDPERVLVAYNGCPPSKPPPPSSRSEIRQDLRLYPGRKMVLYAGNIHPRKGIDLLISMAKLLDDMQFVLVGGIPGSREWVRWERKIATHGIANMAIITRVSPSRAADYMSAADCLIIPPSSYPLTKSGRTVLPLKTFRYLAAGRPIIAPDLPDIREVLKHGHNAVLVPPDSPEVAAQALNSLLADERLQQHISENALRDSRKYTWEARAARISTFLRYLIGDEGRFPSP